jgi:hypothetical protein
LSFFFWWRRFSTLFTICYLCQSHTQFSRDLISYDCDSSLHRAVFRDMSVFATLVAAQRPALRALTRHVPCAPAAITSDGRACFC